jgi:predicted nucleic acid-binding protein
LYSGTKKGLLIKKALDADKFAFAAQIFNEAVKFFQQLIATNIFNIAWNFIDFFDVCKFPWMKI